MWKDFWWFFGLMAVFAAMIPYDLWDGDNVGAVLSLLAVFACAYCAFVEAFRVADAVG